MSYFQKKKTKKKISDFHYFCISKRPSIIKLRTLATTCKPYLRLRQTTILLPLTTRLV